MQRCKRQGVVWRATAAEEKRREEEIIRVGPYSTDHVNSYYYTTNQFQSMAYYSTFKQISILTTSQPRLQFLPSIHIILLQRSINPRIMPVMRPLSMTLPK